MPGEKHDYSSHTKWSKLWMRVLTTLVDAGTSSSAYNTYMSTKANVIMSYKANS
jgi:hypothetical protein